MPFFFGAHDSSKVTFAADVLLIENNDHWPGRWYVLTMLQFVRNTKITVTAGHWWMLVTNPRPIIDYLCIFVFVFDFFVFVFVFVLSTLQQVHWREGMWFPLKGFGTFYQIWSLFTSPFHDTSPNSVRYLSSNACHSNTFLCQLRSWQHIIRTLGSHFSTTRIRND